MNRVSCHSRQRGQSMTEYLVALLVVMMMVGVSFSGEASVIGH